MGGELYRERPSIEDLERMADVEAQQYHRYLLPEQKVKYPSYEELGPTERGWLERGELLTEEEWREEAKQQYRKKLGLGHLQPLPRDWFRTWARTAEALDFYSGKLAKRYGVEKGGVFEKLAKNWNHWADELDKGAKRGMVSDVIGAMGSAAGVIPQVMGLGPGGLATYGAITGGAEAGAKGAVVGGIQGALTHGILRGIAQTPTVGQVPAAFGFGVATEPGTLKERLTSGFTWAGLQMAGGQKPIGMREFIDNYPRIKAKLDDRAAWKFIKKGIPGVTKEQVKAEGGAKEVLNEVMRDVKEQMQKPLVTPEPTVEPAPTVAPEGLTVNVKPQPDGSWEIKLPQIEKEKPAILEAKEAKPPVIERRAPEMAEGRTLFEEAMAERRKQPDYVPEKEAQYAERMREDIRARYPEEAGELPIAKERVGPSIEPTPAAEGKPGFNRDIAMAEIERTVKARWKGKAKSEIDDIVNEVTPTVLRNFDPTKGVKLNTYVTKMLATRYFPDGTLKGQFKKVPEEAKPEIIDRLTQKMELPEEILERKERVKTVTEVLDELTETERAYAHDLMSPKPSVEKVAKRLGVSRETARKGRLKVLEKLRKNDKLSAIVLPYDAWKSEKEGGFFRIGSGEVFEGSIRSRLYKDLFDKFHAIKKLEDIVKAEGIKIPFHESAYINARTIAGVSGKAETKILYKRFTVDPEGNIRFEGKSLRDITMPVRKEIDDFDRYLVYRRVPELAKRGIETGIEVKDAKAFTEKFKKFEPQAKEFTEFHTALLDEMVGAGLLKKDMAQAIKANNQMYAPFQRVVEDLTNYGYIPTSKSTFSKIKAPIKRIKGSLRPIISPLESTVKGTYVITEAIERNKVFNRLIDLRKLSPAAAEIIKPIRPKMAAVAKTEEGETIWRPSTFQRKGVIEGLTKGERHFYEVPADLYDSMTGLTESGFNWVVKVMSLPARILRTGATTTPEFAFRNPIRDQWFAFFNAKYGYVPFYDFAKGLFQLGAKKETYWKWKAAGGEWSMLVTLDRAANQKMLKQVLGASDYKRYMKNPISLLEDISMVMEMPTRIGAFGRAEKKVSDVEAAYQSREASIDFARRGARMKTISSLATFLNANIQARDKTIRTFAENPTKALLKLIPITVVPSIINYLTNRDDPKYWELSEFRRDMFWNIKVKGKYWGVPKGDLGIMFGTTTEKILEYMDKDRETRPEIDKMATMVIKQMMPISDIGGFLPVALRPPVEVMANQKYYTGTPIVSKGKEDLFPELQYGPYTSETAKAIGKKVGVSPSKLEHIITGYGAGLARHGLKISDWMLGEMGAIEKKPKSPKELADYPLVGAFVARDPEGFNSDSVNKFYEVSDKVQKYNRNIGEFKRRGMREEAISAKKEHKAEQLAITKGLYSKLTKARTQLSALRKKQEKILESNLSVEEKKARLDRIDAKVMEVVVPLLAKYRALEEMVR